MGKCRNRKQYSSLIGNQMMCIMCFFFRKKCSFFGENVFFFIKNVGFFWKNVFFSVFIF